MQLNKRFHTDNGWDIYEKDYDPASLVAAGSIFLIGNGYLGYRGTFPEWTKDRYVACIVSDTYDNADGNWTELCNAPNGLYTRLKVDGEEVSFCGNSSAPREEGPYRRGLDLRSGIFFSEATWCGKKGQRAKLKTERFASYADLHILPMRYTIEALSDLILELLTGIDGRVWDLNGKHLHNYRLQAEEGCLTLTAKTGQEAIKLAVLEGHSLAGPKPLTEDIFCDDELILRKLRFNLRAGDKVVLEKVVALYSSNDLADPYTAAKDSLSAALNKSYRQLKKEHIPYWESIWDRADIKIDGDPLAQAILRFNLYHNIIATPMHSDSLPIGARGLSCQAYQGSAFWDQEIFNLPMFINTMPGVARNLLTYRYKTLGGARRKASRLGYRGAFYAWVSGKSGDELCPSFFFTDVLTGRKIRNHFNDWQIHISPDLVYTIWRYYLATGDWRFIEEQGAEIIFEVARFLYSFAYFKKDKHRYELIRVLGPDEYHENVDNNAFTNYLARYSLQKALYVYEKLKTEKPLLWRELCSKISLAESEYLEWREMAELLYLPQPDHQTALIEQFSDYFKLEDVLPGDLEKRLLDKGEYWGWPNGVAVHTQVIKQADVLQLFSIFNNFSSDVSRANFKYYEQRCQHGSSLSPAIHAIVAARIGDPVRAYEYYLKSCLIDLSDTNKAVSGGTFIGGIHTAACGAAWKIIVFGFAGLTIAEDHLAFDPILPGKWRGLNFFLTYRGQYLSFNVENSSIMVKADPRNRDTVTVRAFQERAVIKPGEAVQIKK